MNVFQAEIGRDQNLVAAGNLQHGAVVSNPGGPSAACAQGSLANSLDNELFLQGHWEFQCGEKVTIYEPAATA